MSDPNQDEMRRKRLARLAKLEAAQPSADALGAKSPTTELAGEPSKVIKVRIFRSAATKLQRYFCKMCLYIHKSPMQFLYANKFLILYCIRTHTRHNNLI